MKLSTAIRIGSMTTKQIRIDATDDGNGRCAMGAAIDACGVVVSRTGWPEQITTLFPHINRLVENPATGEYESLMSAIYILNDHCEWTREQIADWVEHLENKWEGKKEAAVSSDMLMWK
jgi:hypothetical protein